MDDGEYVKGKRTQVRPGASFLLQAHHHREERWIVVKATAEIINGD